MLTTLSKPRSQLDGLPICPFLKSYKDKIEIVETDDPLNAVKGFAAFKDLFHLEALVIHGFEADFDYWTDTLDVWNEQFAEQDTICLYMDPEAVEPPIDLDYTWRDNALIIVQRASTLAKHQSDLQKTAYYTHYNDD